MWAQAPQRRIQVKKSTLKINFPSLEEVNTKIYLCLENINILNLGSDQTLSAGEHVYPFNYVLPVNLPSSFEGDYGHVRYSVKVVIDRPWKFDHEAKAIFTVVNPVDLNADPNLIVNN